ncbi:MAG: YjbE family putative metal transport protein [Burkholderiales bacterium]|nr:YjbE family putative metal transport protein [Burkholderiales bacterium]
MAQLADPLFWLALAQIAWVNLLLSGDNAVVIALASRRLPPVQRRRAVIGGTAAAVLLRVLLTLFAVRLLQLPYLKAVGGALLFWIALQLLRPEADDDGAAGTHAHEGLWPAVRTILLADVVMSLDNVLAVAAAAATAPPADRALLLALGLGLSMPFIIGGSQALLALMTRFPALVALGAALLGYLAAEMLLQDPALPWAGALPRGAELALQLGAAAVVVLVGRWWALRTARALRAAQRARAGPP